MGYRNYTGPQYDPSGDLAIAKGMQDFSKSIASGIMANEKRKQLEAEKEAKKLQDQKNNYTKYSGQAKKSFDASAKGFQSIQDKSDDDVILSFKDGVVNRITGETNQAAIGMSDPSASFEEHAKNTDAYNKGMKTVQDGNVAAQTIIEVTDKVGYAHDFQGLEGGLVKNMSPEVQKEFDKLSNAEQVELDHDGEGWKAYDKITGEELKIPENLEKYLIPELSKSISENKAVAAIGEGFKNEFASEAAKVSYIQSNGQDNSVYTYHKDIGGSGTVVATVNRDYVLEKMSPEINKEVESLYKSNPEGFVNYYNEMVAAREEDKLDVDSVDSAKLLNAKKQIVSNQVDKYIQENAGDLKAIARQGLSYAQQVANYKKGTEDASGSLANSANEWLKGVYDAIEYKPTYDDLGTVSRDLSSTFVGRSFGKNFKVHSIEKKSIKGMPAEKYTFNLISRSGSTVDPETGETKPPKVDTFDVDFRNPSSLAQFYLALSGESTKIKGKDKNEVFMFLENTFKQALANQGQDAKTVNESYTQGPSLDLYEDTSSMGLTPNADGTVNIDPTKQKDLDSLGDMYDTNSKK